MIPIVTIDFETYYDGEYSLSKMSTESYIRDSRFETIGCSITLPHEARGKWYVGHDAVKSALHRIDWDTHAMLAHNNYFDGAIAAWIYDIWPRLYMCSMCMGQPIYGFTTGVSLAKLSEALGVGVKGDEVIRALGKHLADFAPHELAQYGEYCINDGLLSRRCAQKLMPALPLKELLAIDETIRCFTDARLLLDTPMLVDYHQHVKDIKETHYLWACNLLGIDDDADGLALDKIRTVIMSNDKLAQLLLEIGCEPPTKLSPATGKPMYAFAKTDDEFLALKDHQDERVQTLVTCRLGGKSTQAETRALKFIEMAERGPMPAYFKYYAAHTGRLGGGDDTNLQNLARGSELRNAIMAPPSHVLIGGDLSQIEARIVAWLAQQVDLVQAFRDFDAKIGPDVYCVTASAFLGREVTPDMKDDRRLGKVIALALQYGMGLDRFIITARRDKVTLTPPEAKRASDWFRHSRNRIPILWKQGEHALRALEKGERYAFGPDECIVVEADGIHLPSGRVLRYPGLQSGPSSMFPGMTEWTYLNRKKRVRLYGAKTIENISQSLAGSVCQDGWLSLRKKLKIVLQVHDELIGMAHETLAQEGCRMMRAALSQEVKYLPGLPVACEVGYAQRFGHIKKS